MESAYSTAGYGHEKGREEESDIIKTKGSNCWYMHLWRSKKYSYYSAKH